MTPQLELNPRTRVLEETQKVPTFPITSLEEDRVISWERPWWYENFPCGAVLPVGSFSGAFDENGVVTEAIFYLMRDLSQKVRSEELRIYLRAD
jgi:hypothetical protein